MRHLYFQNRKSKDFVIHSSVKGILESNNLMIKHNTSFIFNQITGLGVYARMSGYIT